MTCSSVIALVLAELKLCCVAATIIHRCLVVWLRFVSVQLDWSEEKYNCQEKGVQTRSGQRKCGSHGSKEPSFQESRSSLSIGVKTFERHLKWTKEIIVALRKKIHLHELPAQRETTSHVGNFLRYQVVVSSASSERLFFVCPQYTECSSARRYKPASTDQYAPSLSCCRHTAITAVVMHVCVFQSTCKVYVCVCGISHVTCCFLLRI